MSASVASKSNGVLIVSLTAVPQPPASAATRTSERATRVLRIRIGSGQALMCRQSPAIAVVEVYESSSILPSVRDALALIHSFFGLLARQSFMR